MTDFFNCSIKSPHCTDKYNENFFRYRFSFQCFDVPKATNFTSDGVQNRETKNRRLGTIVMSFQDSQPREKQISQIFSHFLKNKALLYHFLANWLAHNKKTIEKSVFRETWSLLFLVSWFSTPPEVKFDAFGTSKHREGKSLSKIISTLGRFNRANKKSLSYTLLTDP